MEELSCNSTKNVYILSQMCINGSDTSTIECVRSDDVATMVLRYGHGGWLIIIAIVGILGNLTTLLSIPFAARRKLHGLDRNFNNTTIFILHLSFIELCWCLMGALPFSYQLLVQQWSFGTFLCKAYAIFMQTMYGTEALALAFISISRCLDLTQPVIWRK